MTRRFRLGMVGGGQGGFFGAAHRAAARLTDRFDLVAGALSSNADRAALSAAELHIAPERSYADFAAMAKAEAARPDGVEVVSIVIPNHLHHAAARAFLEAGIHVVCDKPVTRTLDEALDLEALAAERDLLFAVTYTNSGYGMVRDARAIVGSGRLGTLRLVRAQFAQGWLAAPVEGSGNKQAEWRTDPERSGAGCLADIGTHAFHLAEYISGLRCRSLAAEVGSLVPGRRVDDNAHLLLRFEGGATGALWASQVAIGETGGLAIEIYGNKASLRWHAADPNHLVLSNLDGTRELIERGGPGTRFAGRLPPGHPEGFLEALSQIYEDAAERLGARLDGRADAAFAGKMPDIEDGVRGLRMVEAAVRSKGDWVELSTER